MENTTLNSNLNNNLNNTTTTFFINQYGERILLGAKIIDDHVEFIYKAYPITSFGLVPQQPTIWKEIVKSVDGKMIVVETIGGTYIPEQSESYEF